MNKYLDKDGLATVFGIINTQITELKEKVSQLEEMIKTYHPDEVNE